MYKTPYYAFLVGSRYLSLGGVPVCSVELQLALLESKARCENVVTSDLILTSL